MIYYLNREDLLEYKVKNKKANNSFILYGSNTFDKNLFNMVDVFKSSFNTIKYDPFFSNLLPYNLKIYNKMQTNIGAILIHDLKSINLSIKNYKYNICNDKNCLVCQFSAKSNLIKFNKIFQHFDNIERKYQRKFLIILIYL
jgi:hypothetical protein